MVVDSRVLILEGLVMEHAVLGVPQLCGLHSEEVGIHLGADGSDVLMGRSVADEGFRLSFPEVVRGGVCLGELGDRGGHASFSLGQVLV